MIISETTDEFNDYSANVKADKSDFTDAKFDMTIQVKSIDTKYKERDGHLKALIFFMLKNIPQLLSKEPNLRKWMQILTK